ncbi:MAG: polysaccharide biosynthesis protein, partial [Proteobacteria bacterium]|nr:polysaccharide biosynthesis protein [Pseudomonadota bacterium]
MKRFKIPLSRPDITQKDIHAVVEVLKTPNLSLGPKLSEFERRMADFTETKHAIAVNSGTSGLHLCVRALGIGEGDEVITTPFSFIASSNAILYERAKPVFVDIEPETLNIDVSRVEQKIGDATRAILPVHIFGHPCDMDPLIGIAAQYKLDVIEDACEAIGAEYNGERVGKFGNCAVFAFYPNKQMTTGEGGVVVTNDEKIA